MIPLVTERLILRGWREEDKPAFATINADSEVMRFFPSVLDRDASDRLADRLSRTFAETGITLFAVEEQASGRFIGFTGLQRVPERLPIAPAVEIGWRLAREVWGRGLATEGARAMLRAGFDEYGLDRVVSFTAAGNAPSRRVMEKIDLVRRADLDFDHPDIEEGSPLRLQVVYSVACDESVRSALTAAPG